MNSIIEGVEALLERGSSLKELARLAQACAHSAAPLALDGLLPRLEQAAAAGEDARTHAGRPRCGRALACCTSPPPVTSWLAPPSNAP